MTFEGHCNNFFFHISPGCFADKKKKKISLTLPLLMVLTKWPRWDIYQQHLHTTQAKEHCIIESAH